MAYTTSTIAAQLLPLNYQADTEIISAARWTALIAETDSIIDGELPAFYPFNATGDTPATPGVITRAASLLAASQALRELANANSVPGLADTVDGLRTDAQAILDGIREAPDRWIGPETVSTETLDFSAGSSDLEWGLDSSEAFLAATSPLSSGDPPHVLRDTVAILATSTISGSPGYDATDLSRMRNGIDYEIRLEPSRRRYVFKANRTELWNAGHTIKVSYQWDYRRDLGVSTKNSGVIIGG